METWPYTQKNLQDEDAETEHSILSALTLSGAEFVDQGEAIRLSCNATGVLHAPEDVDWFFQGLKIQSSVQDEIIITKFHSPETKTLISTLEIERSKMKHSGMYICRSTDLTIKSHNVQVINGKYFQRLFRKRVSTKARLLKIAKQTLHYVTLHKVLLIIHYLLIFSFHFSRFSFFCYCSTCSICFSFRFGVFFFCGMFMTEKYSFFNCFAPVNSETLHCYCHIFKSHMRKTSHSNGNQHDMHFCILFSFFPLPQTMSWHSTSTEGN